MKILCISTHDLSNGKTTLHYPAVGIYFVSSWTQYRESRLILKAAEKKYDYPLDQLTLFAQNENLYHYVIKDTGANKMLHIALDAELCNEIGLKLMPHIKEFLAEEHSYDTNVFIRTMKDLCNPEASFPTSSTLKINTNLETTGQPEHANKRMDAIISHGHKVEDMLDKVNTTNDVRQTFQLHAKSLQIMHEPFYKKILRFFSIFFHRICHDHTHEETVASTPPKP